MPKKELLCPWRLQEARVQTFTFRQFPVPAEGPRVCSQHSGGRFALSRVLVKTLVFESLPGTDMSTTELGLLALEL